MYPVWSQGLAEASYYETLRSCPNIREIGLAEYLSAVAAGWKSKLIVEIWSVDYPIEESVGLTIAARRTGGRHVCIVPNELHKENYLKTLQDMGIMLKPELVVANAAETVVPQFEEVDFLVADCTKNNFLSVVNAAKLRAQGTVLLCRQLRVRFFRSKGCELVLEHETGMRVERFVVGKYFDAVHLRSTSRGAPKPPSQPQLQLQSGRIHHLWFHIKDPRCGQVHNFPI